MSSWPAIMSSKPPISTRRWRWPRRSRRPSTARSRFGRFYRWAKCREGESSMGRPGIEPADGPPAPTTTRAIEATFRAERGRILATLIRLVGDFDLAEEALQDALAAALAQWPRDGAPGQPRAWLVGTARHKALDRLRRHSLDRRTSRALEAALELTGGGAEPALDEPPDLPDDRLRLIFTCCH